MAFDLLSWGTDCLRRELCQFASQTVIYVAGTTRLPINATFGRTLSEDVSGEVSVQSRSHDFIINAGELAIKGARFLPNEGNKIEWLRKTDSKTLTFTIMPVGQAWYEMADGFTDAYRIHTRLTKIS